MEAHKQMNLWKTSDIIIVHLKRFVPGNMDKRINTPVALPTEEVDFTPYFTPTSPFIENNKYRLYAVSNHESPDGRCVFFFFEFFCFRR